MRRPLSRSNNLIKPTAIPQIRTVRQDRSAKRRTPTLQRVAKRRLLARQRARKTAKTEREKKELKKAERDALIVPTKKKKRAKKPYILQPKRKH